MNKEEILERSRKENKNRDYAELEVAHQAGNMAWRVGATVCCVISVISHWMKRKTDLFLVVVHYTMGSLAFVFFIIRLLEGIQ